VFFSLPSEWPTFLASDLMERMSVSFFATVHRSSAHLTAGDVLLWKGRQETASSYEKDEHSSGIEALREYKDVYGGRCTCE
jgi:hypothetical protein